MTYNPSAGGGSNDRASHTGTQAISTVTGLQTAIDGKQAAATVLTNTTAAFTTAQESKLAAITGTNTGDQDLSSYATTSAVAAGYQPLDAQLTDLSGLVYAANALKVIRVNAGATGFELATNSASVAWGGITGTLSSQTDLQTALDAKAAASSVPNASYRVLLDSTGSHIAARTASTYGLGQGQPAAITGVGTLYALNTIYIAAADYPTLNGVAAKLRVRAVMAVNDVAPTGNYTFGLHPVTRPATSGGAGLCIYTIGAAVAGSTVALNTPAADSLNNVASADFAIPADGFYVLGFVSTGTVATSSHSHISMALQMRNA